MAGLALFASTPSAAKSIPVCAAETAAAAGADEAANAAGDVVGDVIGALGIPVSDEGIQEQLNQANANLAAMTGFLATIAAATCETNNTLSTPPNTLALLGWSQGLDTEPNVLTIPVQVDGGAGVAFSPMAKEAELANAKVVATAEASLKDPEGSLLDARSDGLKNMQGIGLTNIGTDKAMLKAEALQIERIKTATNIKNLLAVEGMTQIAAVDALNRIDEGVNQLSINTAQIALNTANQERIIRDDHKKTALLFGAVP
jgi:type IV secretion system protein VirB5